MMDGWNLLRRPSDATIEASPSSAPTWAGRGRGSQDGIGVDRGLVPARDAGRESCRLACARACRAGPVPPGDVAGAGRERRTDRRARGQSGVEPLRANKGRPFHVAGGRGFRRAAAGRGRALLPAVRGGGERPGRQRLHQLRPQDRRDRQPRVRGRSRQPIACRRAERDIRESVVQRGGVRKTSAIPGRVADPGHRPSVGDGRLLAPVFRFSRRCSTSSVPFGARSSWRRSSRC